MGRKEFIGKVVNAMDRQTPSCRGGRSAEFRVLAAPETDTRVRTLKRGQAHMAEVCIGLYLSEDWGARPSDSQAEGRERGGEPE